MATEVATALDLDVVLMIPAGEPWQKVGSTTLSPAEDRLAMTRAAVEGVPGLEVSDLEVRRQGPTYTLDTLVELRTQHPAAELFLIVGADAAAGLPSWERYGELPDLCRIVVVDRPGSPSPDPGGLDVLRVEAPRLDLSSTELRERRASGRSLRFMVPDGVISVMDERGLYD